MMLEDEGQGGAFEMHVRVVVLRFDYLEFIDDHFLTASVSCLMNQC